MKAALSCGVWNLPVLLEWSHESCFVLWSLESSVSKLGAGVDKLEVDLLQGYLLGVPSAGDTFEAVTLCDTNDINHLILGKDSSNWNLFLEVVSCEVNLISN